MEKKKYRYPARMLSLSKEELEMARELKEKYHINISAFFRANLRELYKEYVNEKENEK
jgi:hypothetical protein